MRLRPPSHRAANRKPVSELPLRNRHYARVDDHQRRLLREMQDQVRQFRRGSLPVDRLAENLRGLFEAADLKSAEVRGDFESLWARVDAESELRTEPWAPVGQASDAALNDALDAVMSWVRGQLDDADRNVRVCRSSLLGIPSVSGAKPQNVPGAAARRAGDEAASRAAELAQHALRLRALLAADAAEDDRPQPRAEQGPAQAIARLSRHASGPPRRITEPPSSTTI